jgi:hypothetical protein
MDMVGDDLPGLWDNRVEGGRRDELPLRGHTGDTQAHG